MNQEQISEELSFEQTYLEEYFVILEEFFEMFTGKTPDEFSTFKDISKNIRMFFLELMDNLKANNQRLKAVDMLEEKLTDFYERYRQKSLAFAAGHQTYKMLLSGSNSFGYQQFNAVKIGALFAETVLIPDPVLPWIAEEKKNEKFRFANILKETFALLQLRPLVESQWEIPPIWVFPCSEEPLEEDQEDNPITRAKFEVLVADFFHTHLSRKIISYQDALEYVNNHSDDFLLRVDENKLFIPNGCKPGITVDQAVSAYRENLRASRHKAGAAKILALPKHEMVFEGICERLYMQTLLVENLDRYNASPLLPVDGHAYYAELCSQSNNAKISDAGQLATEAIGLFDMVKAHKIEVVVEFTVNSLVEMLSNATFKTIKQTISESFRPFFMSQFHEIDQVATNKITDLYGQIAKFQKDFAAINENLKVSYGNSQKSGPDIFQIRFFFCIAPFILNRLPFGASRKFFGLKGKEMREKAIPTRSYMGLMAQQL